MAVFRPMHGVRETLQSLRFPVLPLLVLLVAVSGTTLAQPLPSHDLEVTLDPVSHRLSGAETVRWNNTGAAATSEIRILLGLNAYAGSATTVSKAQGPPPQERWGWIRITRVQREPDGLNLLPSLELLADPANPDDRTEARIGLPDEVAPGASLLLSLDFEAQLPGMGRGPGFSDTGLHRVAQWYPRIMAADDAGGSGFGSFKVAITVPEGWLVAATGIEIHRGEGATPPGTATATTRIVFGADRVHDFAWVAVPEQLYTVQEGELDPARDVPPAWLREVQQLLGRSAADLELPPIYLRLLVPRSRQAEAELYLHTVRLALVWYGLRFGPFPYPQLTMVVAPGGSGQAAWPGHPTLLYLPVDDTALSLLRWSRSDPAQRLIEEVGHQYFAVLLTPESSNEQWLAGGLARYTALSCLEQLNGEGLLPGVLSQDPWVAARLELAGLAPELPAATEDHSTRAALGLRSLERLLGRERLARALRTYAESLRYHHPTADDLLAVLSEGGTNDLNWFFTLAGGVASEPDWAVREVVNLQRSSSSGLHWDGDAWQENPRDTSGEAAGWLVMLELERRGQVAGPVEVAITYDDGSVERAIWEGRERRVQWRFPAPRPVRQVIIDPDGIWAVETCRRNNYWRDTGTWTRHQVPLWWLREVLALVRLAGLPWS